MSTNDTTTSFDPQPGDKVAIVTPDYAGWRGPHVAFGTVERFTKTQIVVARENGVVSRFRREDMSEVISSNHRGRLASPDDPDVVAALATVKADAFAGKLGRFARDSNSRQTRRQLLSAEVIAQARAAIDAIENAWRVGR